VQLTAHAALEGGIDHLVLLHAGFALEGGGDDVGGIVVSITREVADGDDRIGSASLMKRSMSVADMAMDRSP